MYQYKGSLCDMIERSIKKYKQTSFFWRADLIHKVSLALLKMHKNDY